MASRTPAAPGPSDRGRLLITCPDRPGLVAAVSRFLAERGGNILRSDQHSNHPYGRDFFCRMEFTLPGLDCKWASLTEEFRDLAAPFAMDFRLHRADRTKKVAIFVSRQDHCLLELLWRWRSGELPCEIVHVISNHEDLRPLVEEWGVPFHHVPVDPLDRDRCETEERMLLGSDTDLIVLARYMQILSPSFVRDWPHRIINIHHGFLPAFAGGRAYEQAYERGVKFVGATAHYVTDVLDGGPIIEQDIVRVDHRHGPDDLRRKGKYVEREVLARAVAWHLEDRILVFQGKTVVFS